MSSGLQFTTAAQNPTAAGSVNNFNQALAQSQQYGTNATSAQTNLNTEDNALSQVQTQLQALRTLALEANSGTLTNSNLSSIIATQAAQIQNSLLSLANTQNGNGEYIFGGFAAQTQPFAVSATGATYNGDPGSSAAVQIAAGQTVADGDNGNTVFNQIKTGNGTFAVAAAAGNTGSGIVGATTVSNPAAYAGGTYAITFTAPGTYQITKARDPRHHRHVHRRRHDCIQRRAGNFERPARHGRFVHPGAQHQSKPVHDGAEPGFRAAKRRGHSRFFDQFEQFDQLCDQQHRPGAESELQRSRHRRWAPQFDYHAAVRRDQSADAIAAVHLQLAELGFRLRHHHARSAKHHLERGIAGLQLGRARALSLFKFL